MKGSLELPHLPVKQGGVSPLLLLKLAVFCLVCGQLLLHRDTIGSWVFDIPATHSAANRPQGFSWATTTASRKLNWQPCAVDGDVTFECTRLLVPLDHFNGTTSKEISLALIKVPAKVPVTDARYGGAVLFNPGGPGGSGVGFLLRGYRKLFNVIEGGKDFAKAYDYISFDPRGIGFSEPAVQCFARDELTFAWDLRLMQEGILGSSDAAFGRLWSMTSALSASCSLSVANDNEDIKMFVSTASVAADMIAIIEAHGQWREAEAKRLLSRRDIPNQLSWRVDMETINYWGFSYGTLLGMTFASMYPNRINRFVVDGVVDADDYTKSLWADNLADTEKEMSSFHSYCADAGYPRCALANENGTTTSKDVQHRVKTITDSLIHNPLPIIEPYAEVVTYSDVKNTIFAALYSPIESFPLVANVLRDIEKGSGRLLAALLKPYHQFECPAPATLLDPQPIRNSTARALSHDATIAIGCGDGDPQSFLTRELFREHYNNMTRISPTIGPMWALYRGHCVHWTVRPLHRFVGPWQGDTSYPMLFFGNSADPVTPVRNARKMVQGYKDARLIEQKSPGHCTLAAKSVCSEKIIKSYFQHGDLPGKETICDADEVPFGSASIKTEAANSLLADRMSRGGFQTLFFTL